MRFRQHPMIVRALFALCVAALGADMATAARDADPATWAPPGTLVYFGISDVNKLWKEIEASPGYKAMQDPDLKQLGQRVAFNATVLDQVKARLAKAIDVEPDKLKSPFDGAITLYIPPPGSSKSEPQPVFIAGIGDKELMKTYYEKAVKKMREAASEYTPETAGTAKIDVFSFEKKKEAKGDDEDGDMEHADEDGGDRNGAGEELASQLVEQIFSKGLPPKLAVCLTDERLIVAADKDQIQDALRRERGGDSLAGSDEYKAFERKFDVKGTARFMINVRKLIELSAEKDEENGKKMMDALGAKSFRSLIGQVVYDGKSYDYKLDAVMLMTGERTGLAKILSMKNRPTAPASAALGETCVSFCLNMNPGELLDEIERILRQSDPDEADQMRTAMSAVPLGPEGKVDLRKELFDNLREPLAINIGFTKPFDQTSTRVILSVGHKNKEALERFFGKVAEATGQLTTRDLRGTQVFDTPFKASLAVTSDAILAGSTPAVEAALASSGGENGLAADAAFKRAAALASKESSMMFYVDGRRLMEALLEIAKDRDALMMSAMTNPLNMVPAGMAEAYGEIKPEQREKAKKMLEYVGATIGTLTNTEDGLHVTIVNLLPGKE